MRTDTVDYTEKKDKENKGKCTKSKFIRIWFKENFKREK
jgi:hypothetical protein